MSKRLVARLFIVQALWVPMTVASAGELNSHDRTAPNWSGLYVGIYSGIAWADADFRTNTGAVTSSSYFQFPENTASVSETTSGSLGVGARLAGVQVGFNTRMDSWTFGLEGDYGVFSLHASRGGSEVPYPALGSMPFKYSAATEINTDWLATIRGRIGLLVQPNVLFFATAGLAITKIQVSNFFRDDAPEQGVGGSTKNAVKAALTFGGGAEWGLSKNWSVKVEYLYFDFGSASTSGLITCGPGGTVICTFFNVTPSPYSTSVDLSSHVARAGVSYRF
jgi:outer membrane immunogenic protein